MVIPWGIMHDSFLLNLLSENVHKLIFHWIEESIFKICQYFRLKMIHRISRMKHALMTGPDTNSIVNQESLKVLTTQMITTIMNIASGT